MTFKKGNKFGMKKAEEYEDMDKGESTGDDEEITVPFVSQYPEGRADISTLSDGPIEEETEPMPMSADAMKAKDAISAMRVKLMFHGALKDDGGKNIQRPIPQTSKAVDKRDFVRIGEDRIGVFTKDEAEYLLRVCKGAFTKVEGLS